MQMQAIKRQIEEKQMERDIQKQKDREAHLNDLQLQERMFQ